MFNFLENAHSSIDRIIDKTKLIDDFKFGQHGNIQTNILESLLKSQMGSNNLEDLLKISIGGKFGQNKGIGFGLEGSKGNIGFNLSKSF
jgi:hypothetical protein